MRMWAEQKKRVFWPLLITILQIMSWVSAASRPFPREVEVQAPSSMQSGWESKQMVTMFGMSKIGPWALTDPAVQSSDVVLRMLARNSMSEKLAEDIDKSIKAIIDNAYEIAKTHIRNNREAIDKLVEVLLEKETLNGDESRAILSEFTDIPLEKINTKPVSE